jgi:ribosome-associated translation inhibitor RaiA
MSQVLNITSRDFVLLPAVEAQIREKVAALDTYYDRISHCEVVVEAPAIHHHHKGGPFTVRVRLTVPGAELVADHQGEEELPQAIREAFNTVRANWRVTCDSCEAPSNRAILSNDLRYLNRTRKSPNSSASQDGPS